MIEHLASIRPTSGGSFDDVDGCQRDRPLDDHVCIRRLVDHRVEPGEILGCLYRRRAKVEPDAQGAVGCQRWDRAHGDGIPWVDADHREDPVRRGPRGPEHVGVFRIREHRGAHDAGVDPTASIAASKSAGVPARVADCRCPGCARRGAIHGRAYRDPGGGRHRAHDRTSFIPNGARGSATRWTNWSRCRGSAPGTSRSCPRGPCGRPVGERDRSTYVDRLSPLASQGPANRTISRPRSCLGSRDSAS